MFGGLNLIVPCAALLLVVAPFARCGGSDPGTSGEVARPDDPAAMSLELAELRKSVWEEYAAAARADPRRQQEHEARRIDVSGLGLRWEQRVIGDRPAGGRSLFIALHGGGGAPSATNDSQWLQMQSYYADSVGEGVYVAPRGMTDTWNLHFVDAAYPAYDRLVENMILFEGVDPNRVYVLGFSAGGDGVWQIAPRMADRWAAAAMSAGHPNGVQLHNLHNLPFLAQVGEVDDAYERNREVARQADALDELRRAHPDGYEHVVNIHAGRPHNFPDNDPTRGSHAVLADPKGWLGGDGSERVQRDTNAIAFLESHTREPLPREIVWDRTTIAPSRSAPDLWGGSYRSDLFYWLSVVGHGDRDAGERVVARLETATNAVEVQECGDYLRLLLRADMLDLDRPVTVRIEGQVLKLRLHPSERTMRRTLADRGDPSWMFDAAVTLSRGPEGWVATTD